MWCGVWDTAVTVFRRSQGVGGRGFWGCCPVGAVRSCVLPALLPAGIPHWSDLWEELGVKAGLMTRQYLRSQLLSPEQGWCPQESGWLRLNGWEELISWPFHFPSWRICKPTRITNGEGRSSHWVHRSSLKRPEMTLSMTQWVPGLVFAFPWKAR